MRNARRNLQCRCGARYAALRTGLTYRSVIRLMMVGPTTDRTQYRSLRRRGVLGFWHELKLQLWWYEHGACEAHAAHTAEINQSGQADRAA
jgi:hypothetical protein